MKPSVWPRVKICCIASVDEAWMAIEHGAAALGLVSEMPSGPGPIPEEVIKEIAAVIPPAISSFLLTCRQDVDEIIAQQKYVGVNTIQICDRLEKGSHAKLRKALPGIALVQVIHVTGPDFVEEAVLASRDVDAILLESGNQALPIKELGGTGRVHDWRLSARIREAVGVPLFLAGGLKPANVAEAINQVRPFGVDVCSGLRTEGKLDAEKLGEFFKAIARDRYANC